MKPVTSDFRKPQHSIGCAMLFHHDLFDMRRVLSGQVEGVTYLFEEKPFQLLCPIQFLWVQVELGWKLMLWIHPSVVSKASNLLGQKMVDVGTMSRVSGLQRFELRVRVFPLC